MTKSVTHYSKDKIIEAATHFAIHGSYAKLERDMNIPKATAHSWGTRGEDNWVSTLERVRTENQDKHIANYHRLTEKALRTAERGVDELEGKSLSASDIKSLVVTGATATDKALLLQGKATSISAKGEGINELMAKFEQLSRDHANIQASVVSVQDKDQDNQ